jgi:hypothetical protein
VKWNKNAFYSTTGETNYFPFSFLFFSFFDGGRVTAEGNSYSVSRSTHAAAAAAAARCKNKNKTNLVSHPRRVTRLFFEKMTQNEAQSFFPVKIKALLFLRIK